MGADEIALPILLIQSRQLVLAGTFRYTRTWPVAIHLVASGQVNVDDLVTARYVQDRTDDDALNADRTPGFLKAVVTP